MILTTGIVLYGREKRGERRRLHDEVIHDLHSKYCGVREGANRGM